MSSQQDRLFEACLAEFGPALDRLACAYEYDHELRRDLLQDILAALWRSLAGFDGRCSLRTWVYRVAHNTAAAYAAGRARHRRQEWVSLDEIDNETAPVIAADRGMALERVMALVGRLRPLDRQLVLLWLEGLDTAAISAITGQSATNVTTRIHRIKSILARQFHERPGEELRNHAISSGASVSVAEPANGNNVEPAHARVGEARGALVPVENAG